MPRYSEEVKAKVAENMPPNARKVADVPRETGASEATLSAWRPEFGVGLSGPFVGRILRRLRFRPQRPLRRAYAQDPARVEQWRRKEFPSIQGQAKAENTVIFLADKSGVRSDYHNGHTWAPVGDTPLVPRTGVRFSLQLLSAISAQGETRFIVQERSVASGTPSVHSSPA